MRLVFRSEMHAQQLVFFFSSRRRHTRYWRDWSSDVCSSDLGNWDLVGNNLKIFFIRDAIKFPDMIHAFKPDPVTNRQEPWRFYDFVMHHPEALHMVTWVKSPWGIPAGYRTMEGSSVNTYKLVNDQGVAVLVKFS